MTPFLPDEVEAMRALIQTWPDPRPVVLGAAGLRCFMPMSWRATEDIDLSVAVNVEDATAVLSLLPGWTADPLQEQRWRSPAGIAVDIIPASAEALQQGFVEWPRTGLRMSLVGMRLVFERYADLAIAADLKIRVAQVHVIVVLKMAAYMDNPAVREKDLGDLAHIMHRYIGDDSDRRWSAEVPEDLTEYEDVGPYLLGRDISAVVDREERRVISRFISTIEDDARGPRVLARMAIMAPSGWKDPDVVSDRIRAFRRGFAGR